MKRKGMMHAVGTFVLGLGVIGAAIPPSVAEAGTQAVYYAAPTGSGSTCSIAAPCSLTGARDKVRTVNSSMTGDIVIELRGGTYTLTSPLILSSSDSGTNGYKVIWRNYSSEMPVLSGGQSLSGGWTVHDVSANIYKKTGISTTFRQLYVNGIAAVRARTPNLTSTDSFGPYYRTISADTTAKTYKVNKSEISSWANLNQAEMVLQPHWYHNRLRISNFTSDTQYSYISFLALETNSAFTKSASFYQNNAYHFENAYELLDGEGEWVLNETEDTLYYKPRSGESMSTASVTAPQGETLLRLTGTSASPIHHIEVKGLSFQYTGWNGPSTNGLVATQGVRPITSLTVPAAVQAEYGHHLRFVENNWSNLGGNGLKLRIGVKDSQIVSNQFSYTAANGVVLDDNAVLNPAAADQTENILVGNNTFTRFGQQYSNGMGIVAYFVKDTVVENNSISYGPYMGMQIGGQSCACESGMSNNQIRNNEIHHVMQLHDDGGGIYTLARQPGTRVFENYVHDIAKSSWAMDYPVAALYLDNYSQYIVVEHNVVSNIGPGAQNTYEQTGVGAMDNTWLNNGTQDQAVKDQAGVQSAYVEPIMAQGGTAVAGEDFNSGTVGAAPAGWGLTTTGGTAEIQNVPSSTDKSLYLVKSGSANTVAAEKSFTAIAGISTVEIKIRPEQTSGWKMAPYLKDSSGNVAVSVAFDAGSIKYYNGTLLETAGTFSAGTWYTVKIVSMPAIGKFDLYINGVLKKRGAAMRTSVSNIARLNLSIGTGHTGSFYADSFRAASE